MNNLNLLLKKTLFKQNHKTDYFFYCTMYLYHNEI